MSADASPVSLFAFSGWTTTWPTSLLAIIWLIWLASWVGASLWSGQTRKRVSVVKTSRYHALIVLGGILFTPWTSRLLGETPFWHPGETGVYLLTVVTLAGIAFTWWARIHLGRFWSNAITHKEGHKVIDTGPYGMVRHPIYTGLILGMIATGIAVGTVTAVLGAILISLGMAWKAKMEEVFLAQELGPDYVIYSQRVPMIIPFLPAG
ncbi:methyltransferase family protein [Bradyrhizobium sp. HKCCYLRH3099]|uniref:methyltransferase family protein n=1 Tax=unclassified Bradyrhizobium TaxID=2631580 RepID=UPI003EB80A93